MLWLVIFVIAFSFYEGIRKKKLEEYQQQLETELENYSSEIGEQKQELQLQIDTLTQQQESLK